MAYRYHPEIEGLKVNEDGTEVLYYGKHLAIKPVNRKSRECDTFIVKIRRRVFTVAKIVCECWNGMADNPRWCATRKVKENGFHYTNLYFAPCGTNPAMGTKKVKRSSLSKLTPTDVKNIEERIAQGDVLKQIANDYKVSDMTISRIKKRMKYE